MLERAVRTWTAQVPDVDLADRVLADLHEPMLAVDRQGATVRSGFDGRAWQLLAAACVLIAASAALWTPAGRQPREVATSTAVAGKDVPAPRTSAEDISRRYVAWAEGTGSLVTDAVAAVLPIQSAGGGESSLSPEMPSGWFDNLEPAQREINAAIMFLEQSMKMNDNSAT
jgi:hypothetical protein